MRSSVRSQSSTCVISGLRVTSEGKLGSEAMVEADVKEFELRELWRRYKDEGDDSARERLVVAYSPLVKFVAGRTGARLPSHVEQADLISYGMIGLIEAMDRFEPQRQIRFETFAMQRIRGAIIDELRSLDWVPRSVRSRARDIEEANSKLEHELGRAPSDEELAERAEDERGRAPGGAAADLELLDPRPRGAVDDARRLGRPRLAARHDRGRDARPTRRPPSTPARSRTGSRTRSRTCPSARRW